MYIEIQKNILSIIILAILYISLIRQLNWKENLNKAFLYLILLNIAIIFLDIVIIATTNSDLLISKILMLLSAGLYFIMIPIGALFWLFYVDTVIHQDKKRLYKLAIVPTIFIITNLILVIISYSNGMIFSIGQDNVLTRGPYAFITIIFASSMMIYAMICIHKNRRLIRKQEYFPLMVFAIPPLISAIILMLFKEVNFVWNSLVISQLLIYIYIQSKITSTDFLTGLYNKREYDFLIKSLSTNKLRSVEISGIVVDIDDFKMINDEYGHRIGDEALISTANLLKSAVRKQDYVFRVGGDEFVVVVLSDEKDMVDKIMTRIEEELKIFNQSPTYPFKLSYSLGEGSYDQEEHTSLERFFEYLDSLMYDHKKTSKQEL